MSRDTLIARLVIMVNLCAILFWGVIAVGTMNPWHWGCFALTGVSCGLEILREARSL